jgi:hypothetical protein
MAYVTLTHTPSGAEYAATASDDGTITAVATAEIGELTDADTDRAAALRGDYTYGGDEDALAQWQAWDAAGLVRVNQ